jgi:hypothetical protein
MKGQAFVIGIVVFMGPLCSGCRNASDDMIVHLDDDPERGFRYSDTPVKGVVVWYFTDDPGGKLRISWGPLVGRRESPTEDNYFDLLLSRESMAQVVKTKQIVVVLTGGSRKALPVTISNNKYSRTDRPWAFRP